MFSFNSLNMIIKATLKPFLNSASGPTWSHFLLTDFFPPEHGSHFPVVCSLTILDSIVWRIVGFLVFGILVFYFSMQLTFLDSASNWSLLYYEATGISLHFLGFPYVAFLADSLGSPLHVYDLAVRQVFGQGLVQIWGHSLCGFLMPGDFPLNFQLLCQL